MIIVDADSILYRVGFSNFGTTTDPEPYIQAACGSLLKAIQGVGGVYNDENVIVATTGSGERYRARFDPNYKANRKGTKKPLFITEMKEELAAILGHECYVEVPAPEGEADDFVSYTARKFYKDKNIPPIIIGIDKDLLQIPGHHYNFVTGYHQQVDQLAAEYNLYKQILTGDASDNVKGLKGVGPAKAKKILRNADTPNAMARFSLINYLDAHPEDGTDKFMTTAHLVYLQRTPGELYEYPDSSELTMLETYYQLKRGVKTL
jgi:5'-3' exonuclease